MKIITLLATALFLQVSLMVAPSAIGSSQEVFAQNVVTDQLCNSGEQLDPDACQGDGSASLFGDEGLVGSIVNVLVFIIGAVSVIVILVAGFRFVVSGGDAQAVASARNQILYAIVGLVVAFAAYAIVNWVLDQV